MYDFENLATGKICFKGVNFTFVFDREELRLIPPDDKKSEVEKWFMKEFAPGVYTMGDPVYVEDEYLIGNCNEGIEIVLFPNSHTVGRINGVLRIGIGAYIWKRIHSSVINRIGFESPEMDCIFPTMKAISSKKYSEDGHFSVETIPLTDALSEKQIFYVDEKKVTVQFGIIRKESANWSSPPFSLHSVMYFDFDDTDDYAFVFRLYNIAKVFVQYLNYRKSVPFTDINLSAPFKESQHLQFAKLFILDNLPETEQQCLKDRRYIKYEYIKGNEHKILSDIATGLLYTRNIPNTYVQGRTIDAARFVMITAAFEWEFRRLFPDGIKKKERTINAENVVSEALKELQDKATGKAKDIYKHLIDGIHFTQLSSKIIHTGNELGTIVDMFGKRLYHLNGEELKYSDMGLRIGKQRNNYAHGNLDQEFVGLSLLDLIYLEMVVYAMQLKFYGVSDVNIKKALNGLFRQNLIIKEDEEEKNQ